MDDIAFNAHIRPDNGKTVVWYEFLLDEAKLEAHLSSENPDPSGTALIKKFFEQANKPINDQGQILPPPENEKNRTLKRLALQTAAFLKWDLNLFEKELPISTRHQLLRELLAFCNAASFPSRIMDIQNQIKTMNDHTVMAIVLYCRWAARTVVKSAFPLKPSGRITPTVPPPGLYQVNAQQRCDELREQIVDIVKDQCFDIVQTLEVFLQQVKRPSYIPDYQTIKNKDNMDEKGWLVTCEELHAQVCYDLGCLHFMHSFYDKAYEMFGHVKEWLKCFPEQTSGYCDIKDETLQGYLTACMSLNPKDDSAEETGSDSLYVRVNRCLETNASVRELGEILMEDVQQNEMSMAFRDQLEEKLLHEDSDNHNNVDLFFDVIWSNAVCRAVRGYPQPTCLWTYEMNLAQLQRILGFVQQSYSYLPKKGRKKLGNFLHSLFNNLTKPGLREQLLHCEITQQCLSEVELHEMRSQASEALDDDATIIQDSPSSPQAELTGAALMMRLEGDLVTSFDPCFLKETLTKLHKISPDAQHWKICDQWNVNPEYEAILRTISVAVSKDLMFILLAKTNQCFADKEHYSTAKTLLTYIQENGKSLSFKLHKIACNEMLKVELLELINDPSLKFSTENECRELREQLSDVIKRVKQHLLTMSSDVVPSPSELIDLSITLLLNLEDYVFFDSVSKQSAGDHLRLVKHLAKVRSKIASSSPPHSEAKRAANELWNVVAEIFAASIYHQRRSQDGAMVIQKLPDVPNPLVARPAFLAIVKKIRNENVLQFIISLLVRLHRICQEDILSEIKVPYADLWPSSIGGNQRAVSGPCLANAMKEILSYCLSIQPHKLSWVRTQADIDFAYCNYPAAFRGYLKLGAIQTNYFNKNILSLMLREGQLTRRMVKCCLQMKCNTQAAVLCQMMKEVDYSTAFKALQESRERADGMEIHYREHFWDVELLEYTTCVHRDSGEVAKKESALRALADPDINVCNTPKVLADVANVRSQRFFRALARQYLC